VEGIPGELIFVLIFIAFSVLEAVGRKKGARRKGGPGRAPGSEGGSRERGERREGMPRAREAGADSRSSAGKTEEAPASSEGLIPEDIWEEILGLARGTPQKQSEPRSRPRPEVQQDMAGRDLPSSEVETIEEIPPFEARSLEPLEPRPEPNRGLPDPSGARAGLPDVHVPPPPKSKIKGVPSLAASEIGTGPGVKARPRRKPKGGRVRQEIFGDGSREELRKAVILREVLGKPVGMEE